MNGELSAETGTVKLRGLYWSYSDICNVSFFVIENLAIVLITSLLSCEPNSQQLFHIMSSKLSK